MNEDQNQNPNPTPGQVIQPGNPSPGQQSPQPQPEVPQASAGEHSEPTPENVNQPQREQPSPSPTPTPQAPEETKPTQPQEQPQSPEPTQEPASPSTNPSQQFEVTSPGPHQSSVHIAADAVNDDVVSWEASEFVHHEKNSGWFILAVVAGAILTVGMFFIVDLLSAAVIGIMTIGFVIFARKKPRVLRYTLSNNGLKIGDRAFSFADFRSFSLAHDGPFVSVDLIPLKRFMPPVSIYFSQEDSNQILDILSLYLPHEDHRSDPVDRLFEKLRF